MPQAQPQPQAHKPPHPPRAVALPRRRAAWLGLALLLTGCAATQGHTTSPSLAAAPSPPDPTLKRAINAPPMGPPPADAPPDLAQHVSGRAHRCALRADGTAWCWGNNDHGQLGDGSLISRASAAPALYIRDAVALAARHDYTCALRADGEVWCWGGNDMGQLGDGATVTRPTPSQTPALPLPARALSAQADQACALLSDGAVWCWGRGSAAGPAPVAGFGGEEIAQLISGAQFSCARSREGNVWCWGDISWPGCARCAIDRPAPVLDIVGATEVLASPSHPFACALLPDAQTQCWGRRP
jgi:hypothetical protein